MSKKVSRIPQPGDRGNHVAGLQMALNSFGASIVVDGIFGPKTRAAVSTFQKRNGLPGSGVPGPITMYRLGLDLERPATNTPASTRPTSGRDHDEGTPPWYRKMFRAIVVSPGMENQIEREIKPILDNLPRYKEVSRRLGFSGEYLDLFAIILGCLHKKEASNNFTGALHNGDEIIGTDRKTYRVPKGRGPFKTWEDSAVDAINFNGSRWSKLRAGSTDIGDILYAIERYNGTGYITGAGKEDVSPYLWENSNISDGYGKYVSDGKYNPNFRLGKSTGIAVILHKLYELGVFKCTGVDKEMVLDPLPTIPSSKEEITREVVADMIVALIKKDIDAELRETHGKNRSPRIDEFNRRAKSYLGAPYCASAAWCAIDDACKELGLKNPVPPTASSQDFRRPTFVPQKYIRPDQSLGKKGDVGVLQVPHNSAHGHHTTLCEDQVSQPLFNTYEYNTDGSGTRDGDGAYPMTRSTRDRSSDNTGKIFVCFTDVPQWIVDFNKQ